MLHAGLRPLIGYPFCRRLVLVLVLGSLLMFSKMALGGALFSINCWEGNLAS
jgi:hypothetical protein